MALSLGPIKGGISENEKLFVDQINLKWKHHKDL